MSGVLFLWFEGGVVGWLADGREGDPEAFLFLLAGVWKPVSVMSIVVIIINDNFKFESYKIRTQGNNSMVQYGNWDSYWDETNHK